MRPHVGLGEGGMAVTAGRLEYRAARRRMENNMKIGVLGSGDVAKSLARGFMAHGHEPMLGTRDRAKLEGWVAQNPRAAVGSFADAAGFGELLVLAVKGSVAADVLRAAGTANLAGKPSSIRPTRLPMRPPPTAF